ncbi:MAG: hypothetical protein KJ070_08935, partial [Verrucomicrobia bacterium]|nr:hypothetical protein [Verrucomicrobiota bacterium]
PLPHREESELKLMSHSIWKRTTVRELAGTSAFRPNDTSERILIALPVRDAVVMRPGDNFEALCLRSKARVVKTSINQ